MRNIPIIETGPIANPPSNHYERGKWYKRRGYLEQALESFKAAAHTTSTDIESREWKEVDPSWLEYGLLSMRMRLFAKSEEAFRIVVQHSGTYAQEALNQWAALLLMKGMPDQLICERLLDETRNYNTAPSMVGKSMFYIGAYRYASLCFAKQKRIYSDSCIQNAASMVMTGQIAEALQFIDHYLHEHHGDPIKRPNARTSEAIQLSRIGKLCKWSLADSIPDRFIFKSEALELARMAVSLNMVPIAEALLPEQDTSAYYALICFLYYEGYRDLAISKMGQLEALPLDGRDTFSKKLCFIAAENLYIHRKYHEAASLFEQLRLADPLHEETRFGEAACYLQTTLISLSSRLEAQYTSASASQEIKSHMNNVNTALHIVESTNWRTIWSPAQDRIENSKPKSILN
ncbi:tetratricopeptide repeat protein [Paenibacillus solani]|uniref:tetratricopeptide repeat protein n=1 Tax=Paenibacillus solani TaxID=1705565 RepID=UPI003D275C93